MRGEIRNRLISNQVINYSDLRWGKITPTDLDGFLDFGNKVFILIEYKFRDTEIPYGQKLALERLVDAISKPCILIHAVHNHEPDKDIDGANATVAQIYFRGRWFPDGRRTVKQVVDAFIETYAK